MGEIFEFAHEKKNHLSDNEPTRTKSYRQHIYLYIWTPKKNTSSTHPQFLFRTSCTNRWDVMNVRWDASTSTKQRTEITRWECLHIAWWRRAFSIFPPWFTPDKCRVRWERCVWFHWLALQGFAGLTGLFPPLNVEGLSLSLLHLSLLLALNPDRQTS